MTNCPRNNCKNKAQIDPQIGVLPCEGCIDSDSNLRPVSRPEFYSTKRSDRINQQRDQFAKDILQPWDGLKPNPEFVKAFPEKAIDHFSPEQLSKL